MTIEILIIQKVQRERGSMIEYELIKLLIKMMLMQF